MFIIVIAVLHFFFVESYGRTEYGGFRDSCDVPEITGINKTIEILLEMVQGSHLVLFNYVFIF